LEAIDIQSVNSACSKLLNALALSALPLQVLKLANLRFEYEIYRIHLIVSGFRFVSEEFQQLFGRLGLINIVAVLIAFDARDLIIDVGCWKVLGTVDFDAFQANLCEADWSEDRMPAGSLR
jgi:hypothetical protein